MKTITRKPEETNHPKESDVPSLREARVRAWDALRGLAAHPEASIEVQAICNFVLEGLRQPYERERQRELRDLFRVVA